MFANLFFTAVVVFFPKQVFAQHTYDTPPSIGKYQLRIDPLSQKVNLGLIGKSPQLTYQSIKAEKPQSVSDVLRIIQNKAPQLFDQSVLIHTSASLQPSFIDKKPRILMFGENLTLSFSALQDEVKSVEFLQFDNKKFTYSMHEIVFPKAGGVQFVDAPKECASCHGEKPRPIWEGYDFWPSAIGSQSGGTHSDGEQKLMDWVTAETQTHPVLQKINTRTLKESIDTFTAYLSQQNFLRATEKVATELKPNGKLHPFRYAILGLLTCTSKSFGATIEENIIFKEFIPKSVRDQWKISFDQVYYDVEFSNKRVKDTLWEYYLRNFPGNKFPGDPIGGLTRLRVAEIGTGSQLGYIFANLGLNLRDYTLSYREDSYIMSTPNVTDLDLQKTFLYFMPEVLDELQFSIKKIQGADFEYYDFDCDELKKKSRAALETQLVSAAPELLTAMKPQKGLSPIGMCVSCHAMKIVPGGMQPPYIAFDNTYVLGEQLRSTDLFEEIKDRINREDLKQMPKDLPHLTEAQKDSLLSVLKKIEKGSRP